MSKSLVEKQFGAHAARYVNSPVHAKGASLQRLVDLVKPQAHWHALDVATAAGHTALAFAPHVVHVIASDLTDEMLVEAGKLAASRGVSNLETAKADAEALPFASASFDLVTCRIAPHHFPDAACFVSEVWRVLKPGGTFGLVDNISPDAQSTPGYSDAELNVAAKTYNDFERLRDPSHGRCLPIGEWRRIISDVGFAITHQEVLPKTMDFLTWGERMDVPQADMKRLEAVLIEASPALAAFLRPRRDDDGRLSFTLDEVLIIARKP